MATYDTTGTGLNKYFSKDKKDYTDISKNSIIGYIDGEPIFSKKQDALNRAQELNCTGFHKMEYGGKKGFMACKTHAEAIDVKPKQGVVVNEIFHVFKVRAYWNMLPVAPTTWSNIHNAFTNVWTVGSYTFPHPSNAITNQISQGLQVINPHNPLSPCQCGNLAGDNWQGTQTHGQYPNVTPPYLYTVQHPMTNFFQLADVQTPQNIWVNEGYVGTSENYTVPSGYGPPDSNYIAYGNQLTLNPVPQYDSIAIFNGNVLNVGDIIRGAFDDQIGSISTWDPGRNPNVTHPTFANKRNFYHYPNNAAWGPLADKRIEPCFEYLGKFDENSWTQYGQANNFDATPQFGHPGATTNQTWHSPDSPIHVGPTTAALTSHGLDVHISSFDVASNTPYPIPRIGWDRFRAPFKPLPSPANHDNTTVSSDCKDCFRVNPFTEEQRLKTKVDICPCADPNSGVVIDPTTCKVINTGGVQGLTNGQDVTLRHQQVNFQGVNSTNATVSLNMWTRPDITIENPNNPPAVGAAQSQLTTHSFGWVNGTATTTSLMNTWNQFYNNHYITPHVGMTVDLNDIYGSTSQNSQTLPNGLFPQGGWGSGKGVIKAIHPSCDGGFSAGSNQNFPHNVETTTPCDCAGGASNAFNSWPYTYATTWPVWNGTMQNLSANYDYANQASYCEWCQDFANNPSAGFNPYPQTWVGGPYDNSFCGCCPGNTSGQPQIPPTGTLI